MTYSCIVELNPNNCRTKHCRTSQQSPQQIIQNDWILILKNGFSRIPFIFRQFAKKVQPSQEFGKQGVICILRLWLLMSYDYRIYSRISRSAYKSNCNFSGNISSKIGNPRISRINKLKKKNPEIIVIQ
jgi:hypothetical protein